MKPRQFWVTRLGEIEKFLGALKAGKVRTLCKSAGGRPVYAVEFGKKLDIARTANYASAMQARRPQAFFGKSRARTRAIVMIAGIHGAEVEGVMAMVNLANIIERGCDLAGNPRPSIASAAKGLRVVIVPLANPDGRERLPIEDLVGHPVRDIPRYGQGVWANGRVMRHPGMKRVHPMSKDVKFLGGYFNDDGVNIQADCEFTAFLARETRALLELTIEEVPEATVNIHSCSLGPFSLYKGASLPAPYDVRLAQVAEVAHRLLVARRLRPEPPYRHTGGDGMVSINTLFHYLTGALPICYEGPHGTKDNPFTHEEILEIHLAFAEAHLTLLKDEGLRPPLPC